MNISELFNSVTTVTSEKNAVVTAQPLIDKAVTSVTTVTSRKTILETEKAANDDYPHEVICYTPNGQPLAVTAQNAEHAAWLLAVNPKPKDKTK